MDFDFLFRYLENFLKFVKERLSNWSSEQEQTKSEVNIMRFDDDAVDEFTIPGAIQNLRCIMM